MSQISVLVWPISIMHLLLVVLYVSSAYAISKAAESCGPQCIRENDCACGSLESPIETRLTPQFVTLTFDDAATAANYDTYYNEFLFNRNNHDGKPITATFYVPHPYTDYEVVNKLYNKGFDIGIHSVTKEEVEYWRNATEEELLLEFKNSREIISKFANIPIDDVIGVRTPHFELNGDATLKAYIGAGLVYDSSFVTRSDNPVFPFTLEYRMNHQCIVGKCPTESYPHFWILPIINLNGPSGNECNALLACQITGSAEEIKNWFIEQFQRVYVKNRAPITFIMNSVWFQIVENSSEGFKLFLDYLGTNRDVYLVSHSEVVAWSRNPVSVETYTTNHNSKSQNCAAATCFLKFEELNEERIMRSCVACPQKYPWLGNPNGN